MSVYAVKISSENINECYVFIPEDFRGNFNYFYDDEKEGAFKFLEMHLRSRFGRNENVKGGIFDRTRRVKKNNMQQLPINQIAEAVHNLAKEKGWHDEAESEDHFIERTCNNIHNEVSELHEAWRNNRIHLPCDKAGQMNKMSLKPLTCLEEEMADIIIRALDTCIKLKLNPQDIITRKHIFNTTRPHRHGGKRS